MTTTIELIDEADLDESIKADILAAADAKPKPNHYVDNAKLLVELTKYCDAVRATPKGQPKPRVPEYVGKCILLTVEGLSKKASYRGYSYREEMVGDAIENCLLYIHNFDQKTSKNPFGYITMIASRAFWRRILREQKQRYIKAKKIHAAGITEIAVAQDEGDDENYHNTYVEYLQQDSDFIRDFEEKLNNKRKRRIKTDKVTKDGVENLMGDGE